MKTLPESPSRLLEAKRLENALETGYKGEPEYAAER